MNTPDRSGPRYDLVANAVLNEGPAFPFQTCPNNGFCAMSPAPQYTPAVVPVEILVKGISLANCRSPFIFEDSRKIAISLAQVRQYGTSWSDTVTNFENSLSDEQRTSLNEQATYMIRLRLPDKDNLTVTIFNYGAGDQIATATLNVTDLFSGNPSFVIGYPTDAQLVGLTLDNALPSPDISVLSVQAINPGPSAITLSPAVATTSAEVGYWVGNLWATHARSAALPCTFALVTGTGDTNNASFSIRGTNLHVAGTLTAGAKSVRIQATDRYGATFAAAKTITVS